VLERVSPDPQWKESLDANHWGDVLNELGLATKLD
jgi:hypothetical protein